MDLLNAQVLSLVSKKAILLVQGKTVTVDNQKANLKEGQLIRANITKNGNEASLVRHEVIGESAHKSLNTALKSINQPITENNLQILNSILNMGLTVDAKLFNEVARQLNMLPIMTDSYLQGLILLVSLGLPISKGSLNILERFYAHKLDIKLLLKQLNANQISPNLFENLADEGLDLKQVLKKSLSNYERDLLAENQNTLNLAKNLGQNLTKELVDLMSVYKLLYAKNEDYLLFSLVYLFNNEKLPLTIRYQKKKITSEESILSLDLFLELSALGKLAITLETDTNKNLNIWFKLPELEAFNLIKEESLAIKDELTNLNQFKLVNLYFLNQDFVIPEVLNKFSLNKDGLDVKA